MAGHSKWANIKRQKARVDAVKGKVFTKISREIIVAARSGVPDPAANFQLRTAIEKAKAASIPADNIDRAIAKGAGKGADSSELEAIRYEGYGCGGVAVLIEALTDNRNRTAATLREAFSKNGGNLGESGCVGWMFEQKGVVEVAMTTSTTKRGRTRTFERDPINEEEFLEACLEGGAEAYDLIDTEDGTVAEVVTDIETLESLSQTLKDRYTISLVELRWIPTTTIEVTQPDHARSLLKLMDALEDLDDVQSVTANFEMAADLMTSSLA